jgi:hypothetical protein
MIGTGVLPLAVRLLALAALIVVVATLLGCASEPYVSLPDWTVTCDGCTPAPVHLPGNFSRKVAPGITRYELHTDAALPEDMRGSELTLMVAPVYTLGHLRVGTEDIEPLDGSVVDRVRPASMQLAFRIPARLTTVDHLALTLVLDHTDSIVSAHVGSPVRLSVGPYGDAESRVALAINRTSGTAMMSIAGVLALGYLGLFALDRRRAVDGYFAIIAAGLALWHANVGGLTQWLGVHDIERVPALTTAIICVAAPGFVHAHFGRKAPPRVLITTLVILGAVMCGIAWASVLPVVWTRVMQVQIVIMVGYLFWFLGRAILRGDDRFDAAWMLGCWLMVGVAAAYNPVRQIHISSLAWIVFILVHALLLARAHTRSLRALNAELANRIARVEESNREIATLNDELRRQVGDRSARLVEAFARAGRLKLDAAPLEPGAEIGDRYIILRRLGEGAMGVVYEVQRTGNGKRFAMKTVTQAHAGTALARLAREAEIATKVVHPNVVSIVDVDLSPAGVLYIVMELVKGMPLGSESARYGDAAWAIAILRQIAAGLRALHDAGIVHRDLKPANVLLEPGPDGTTSAKIADFGIARLARTQSSGDATREPASVSPLAASDDAGNDPSLTRTGALMGTPLYMAPESARGAKDAQPSSDMWSFGVMAYELATGRMPFEVPPIRAIEAKGEWKGTIPDTTGLPPPLRAIVTRCLDAQPANRMTAREALDALQGLEAGGA